MIRVVIPMAAKGKARARAGANGFYTPARTARAEHHIATLFLTAMKGALPIDGPVRMQVVAEYVPPASWPKYRREAAMTGWPKTTKPDSDNIWKLVADALNGIAYRDDALIADAAVAKVYGPEDRITITVEAMT